MSYGSIIAAISTPPGKGGVAIIRISGHGAFEVADKAFKPRSGRPLSSYEARKQIFGDVIYRGQKIDDGLATRFPAPASYTGEDTVEISCHGGLLITQRVLEAVLSQGARPADAGEFTRRAFINGRISLTEAEAIGGLLEAKSDGQIKLYSGSARNRLAEAIQQIRGDITAILASVFARIDYPDEELEDLSYEETINMLSGIEAAVNQLISTYPTGRAVSEGVHTVICGKPNVGKSSVYNLILGEDAAIVTHIAGTTRDVLSRSVSVGNLLINLYDTAGVRRYTEDVVERIGIERSLSEIEKAELIIGVFDGSRPMDDEDLSLLKHLTDIKATKLAIINKSDLQSVIARSDIEKVFDHTVIISAKESPKEAYSEIESFITGSFSRGDIDISNDAVISSARQNAALVRCLEFIRAAKDAYASGIYADAAASEVERALGAISELDGRAVSEEVVGEIFSKFCVGK